MQNPRTGYVLKYSNNMQEKESQGDASAFPSLGAICPQRELGDRNLVLNLGAISSSAKASHVHVYNPSLNYVNSGHPEVSRVHTSHSAISCQPAPAFIAFAGDRIEPSCPCSYDPQFIQRDPINCAVRRSGFPPITALAEDCLDPRPSSSNCEQSTYGGIYIASKHEDLCPTAMSTMCDSPFRLQDDTLAAALDAPEGTAGHSFARPKERPDFLSLREPEVRFDLNIMTSPPSYDAVPSPASCVVARSGQARLAHSDTIEQLVSMPGAFKNPKVLAIFCRSKVPGVPLKDFVDPCGGGMMADLDDADDTSAFQGFNPKLRLDGKYSRSKARYMLFWPGYPLKTRQQYVYSPTTGLITRREVVIQVAKFVQDFFATYEHIELSARNKHKKWSIGSQGIKLEDLELVELRQISKASVLPVLRCSKAV
ncbi:hypothetical protein NM688_g3150 [Phlebia brevispora]|uniref:Uncharacterized protein n=1 Tax=Phlebia brevispora TaxID=194682 RepID=A0ACC1T6C6_9APHY|nr:hypothetical protein NM688_g3150 [Phlebia brevispora]